MDAVGGNGLISDAERSGVGDAPASQVFKRRNVVPLTQFNKLFQRRPLRETHHPEIAGVHTEQQTRIVIDGLFVIFDAGAVRRADFAQASATTRHDFRNAE